MWRMCELPVRSSLNLGPDRDERSTKDDGNYSQKQDEHKLFISPEKWTWMLRICIEHIIIVLCRSHELKG